MGALTVKVNVVKAVWGADSVTAMVTRYVPDRPQAWLSVPPVRTVGQAHTHLAVIRSR
jgi:hypothetical protein